MKKTRSEDVVCIVVLLLLNYLTDQIIDASELPGISLLAHVVIKCRKDSVTRQEGPHQVDTIHTF